MPGFSVGRQICLCQRYCANVNHFAVQSLNCGILSQRGGIPRVIFAEQGETSLVCKKDCLLLNSEAMMGMGVCAGFPSPTKGIWIKGNTLEMRSCWARVLHRASLPWLPGVVPWDGAETGPGAFALTVYKKLRPSIQLSVINAQCLDHCK